MAETIGVVGAGALGTLLATRLARGGHAVRVAVRSESRRDALRREVTDSREMLRARFDVPVDFFCYPAGRYDAKVIAAVRRVGYLGATTTVEGLAGPQDPYELRRVRVSRSDGVGGLAEKLGDYRAPDA